MNSYIPPTAWRRLEPLKSSTILNSVRIAHSLVKILRLGLAAGGGDLVDQVAN
jgi:hypothetical protein